jgi:hypothetical protein
MGAIVMNLTNTSPAQKLDLILDSSFITSNCPALFDYDILPRLPDGIRRRWRNNITESVGTVKELCKSIMITYRMGFWWGEKAILGERR